MAKISSLSARQIFDSRGNPTVCCTITLDSGETSMAMVPSGASTGEHEAVELRDGDSTAFQGKGVLKACKALLGPIRAILVGKDVEDQYFLDQLMINADGTENKSQFGANAILAASLAIARAAAQHKKIPLYRHIGGINCRRLPVPMLNIINGGVHADSSLEFQEFMVRPHGFSCFKDALKSGVEVFHTLKGLLKEKGYATSVGDEGGFAPNLHSHEEALELIVKAIEKAGYKPGEEISLALDCAASELFNKETNTYHERKKEKRGEKGLVRTAAEYTAYLKGLTEAFPITSIEDGLAENDWDGWKILTKELTSIQNVGDDIFVTNPKFLSRAIEEGVGNAILIKLNQIGSLSETLDTIQMAQKAGYQTIISHRSGETEDTFIADLAVATNSGQIKTGAPSRSDRVAKYNRLLAIEEELNSGALY